MAFYLSRAEAMFRAVDFLRRSEIRGAYYEFGVSSGQTAVGAMSAARKLAADPPAGGIDRFFLFDSFKGLPPIGPDDRLAGYEAVWEGRFKVPQDEVETVIQGAGHDLSRVSLVPGFYEESLKRPETLALVQESPAALVHVDCDLYTSARDCLGFMTGRFVDGAILMFDDWFIYRGRPDMGVQRAFHEWVGGSGLIVQEYFRYHWASICFICNTKEPPA
jgi:hypothetical protein